MSDIELIEVAELLLKAAAECPESTGVKYKATAGALLREYNSRLTVRLLAQAGREGDAATERFLEAIHSKTPNDRINWPVAAAYLFGLAGFGLLLCARLDLLK